MTEDYHQSPEILDLDDELKDLREEFYFPTNDQGDEYLYFAGHSLGLQPRKAAPYIERELHDWARYGVEGHLEAENPWLPYHENVTASLARLVGARPIEVVAMNSLTVNLHLMMISFYRPTRERYKILIEASAFPSDQYAVDSQARLHGYDPKDAIIELRPREGADTIRQDDILKAIDEHGDSIALIMLGNVNYLTGQCFSIPEITQAGHKKGCFVGFDLAHGAGNLELHLHDWNVDFAVWCSYKYLNSGPGAIAGAFVHEKHSGLKDIPRLEGWWGTNKTERFLMKRTFDPIVGVEAWQLSNPPIFQLAALRASLELFDRAGIQNLREKSLRLTGYLEFLLRTQLKERVEILTPHVPAERGSMLSIRIRGADRSFSKEIQDRGAICDFREPNVFRIAPIPLYNSFTDVYQLVEILKEIIGK